ncbi:MAG: exodeoxyribonuclease III [Deltaproteobacteria bacterium]|nr:exodeoxyribonuclease III [Deltaproteobacteria bacterium]MBW2308430.1 exodeoxyribonuclease III [Deltaproteobacteria bacterium]
MSWKLATFNVNGVRARLPIVIDWLKQRRPDVLCLQEIKCQENDFPAEQFLEAGYVVNVRGQKSFNGVAVLSGERPERVVREFGDGLPDEEARLIAVLVEGVWIVNTYVPQGRALDDPAFRYKLDFFARLRRWFESRFTPGQPLIWTGDMNVAPQEIDVFDPKRLDGEVGFHPAERTAFAEAAAWGFIDLFRVHHPGQKQFTFWDYRLPKSFQRNLGWRLDHIMATEPLAAVSIQCLVDTEPRGRPKPSDHTPVCAEFDLEKL